MHSHAALQDRPGGLQADGVFLAPGGHQRVSAARPARRERLPTASANRSVRTSATRRRKSPSASQVWTVRSPPPAPLAASRTFSAGGQGQGHRLAPAVVCHSAPTSWARTGGHAPQAFHAARNHARRPV